MRMLVMRLADMHRVHPEQIESTCKECGEVVAVYPSGQRVMKLYADLELICNVCGKSDSIPILAPGAIEEAKQSVKRK